MVKIYHIPIQYSPFRQIRIPTLSYSKVQTHYISSTARASIYSYNLLTISLTSSCMFVWFSKQYLKSKIHRSLLVHDQISFVMCFLHSYEFPITDYTSFYVMTCKRAHHFAGCLLEIKLWLMGTMHSMLLRSRQIDLSG